MGIIYRRLADARNALGFKQREIAALASISLRAYARYESGEGERDIPSSVLDVYARNGINISWLLTGEGPMFLSEQKKISPSDQTIDEIVRLLGELDEQGKQAVLLAARQADRIVKLEKQLAG